MILYRDYYFYKDIRELSITNFRIYLAKNGKGQYHGKEGVEKGARTDSHSWASFRKN